MEVTFWGVRGSYPVSSPHCVRYGGNTPCIEINAQGTCIVIDAGTGICTLGKHLVEQGQREIHLLISHTHWDHIHGFPHFAPLQERGTRVDLYSMAHPDRTLCQILAQQQQQPFFPVQLEQAHAALEFTDLVEGQQWQIGPTNVLCKRLNHPSYTGGFRIECAGKVFSYVSDTDLYGPRLHGAGMNEGSDEELEDRRIELQKGAVQLAQDADLMVFDSFFLPDEYKDDWGHSRTDDALRLGEEANVRRTAFFHHAPNRSDEQLDAIVADCSKRAPDNALLAATEGDHLVL